MSTLAIWLGTLVLLLPATVTAVWVAQRLAPGLAPQDGELDGDSEGPSDCESTLPMEVGEPEFSELTSAEIDSILDYYEQRQELLAAK